MITQALQKAKKELKLFIDSMKQETYFWSISVNFVIKQFCDSYSEASIFVASSQQPRDDTVLKCNVESSFPI